LFSNKDLIAVRITEYKLGHPELVEGPDTLLYLNRRIVLPAAE
jgi:hypothetical protein